MNNEEYFIEAVAEVKKKGYYVCSNVELWEKLYQHLKPDFPTLYKWQDKNFQYLNIISNDQTNNISSMIGRATQLKKELIDIEFILFHSDLDFTPTVENQELLKLVLQELTINRKKHLNT